MIKIIENEKLKLSIDTIGAEMKSLIKDDIEYLWQGKEIWKGTAPNLFPFIGRLYNSKYSYNGKEYDMGIHGFLRKSTLKVIEEGKEYIILGLESNKETLAIYPFEFKITYTYRLVCNAIELTVDVTNLGENTMYFALGFHPGFNVPLNKNLSFNDYYCEFKDECQPRSVIFTKNVLFNDEYKDYKLIDNKRINLNHSLFDDDAIFLDRVSNEITLKSDKDSRYVKLIYPDMKYVGLWHMPKVECDYVCIEPWSSMVGRDFKVEDLESRDDFIKLNSKSSYTAKLIIEIN